MDSKINVLFMVIAIGGWVVQSVIKKRRRDAARDAAEVYDGAVFDESVTDDDEEFVPAVAAYANEDMGAEASVTSPRTLITDRQDSRLPDGGGQPADEPVRETAPREGLRFGGRSLRDAVIMSEVLRRPKGLR
jgi:hypothetical protein